SQQQRTAPGSSRLATSDGAIRATPAPSPRRDGGPRKHRGCHRQGGGARRGPTDRRRPQGAPERQAGALAEPRAVGASPAQDPRVRQAGYASGDLGDCGPGARAARRTWSHAAAGRIQLAPVGRQAVYAATSYVGSLSDNPGQMNDTPDHEALYRQAESQAG